MVATPLPAVEKPDAAALHDPKSTMLPPYREGRVLAISCLTSIATIIGSGILALPVTLYATSVPLFLIVFSVSLLGQVGVICAVVELMQRAKAASARTGTSYDSIEERDAPDVSLFSIAHHYLQTRLLRYAFYVATFLAFVSMLVSYGLAGPQAVWQLATTGPSTSHPSSAMFAAYWTVGTCAVVFFVDVLLGVFGSFTVLKGVLFVCVVIIVAALPPAARVTSIADLFGDFSGFNTVASPFLMSCVALGGLANTMPVTFKLLPSEPSRAQVARYRGAILLAAFLCYLLNVGWVLAVLQVVPRTAVPGKPSLTNAYNLGQISTVPLIDVLHHGDAVRGGVLKAIELIVELFIFVSTGVSFFVTAAGMKSFVDGGVSTLASGWRASGSFKWLPTLVAYVMSFGSVLLIILANPNGFISVLTRFTSMALNLQAGLLLFVMLYNSRSQRSSSETVESNAEVAEDEEGNQSQSIPLVMKPAVAAGWIAYCVPFFSFACILAMAGPLLGIRLGGSE